MIYRMENGNVVNTEKSVQCWEEESYWDGSNHISKATGSQWDHETLYRSRKGRFYVVHESQWQGSHDHCEWVDEREAVRWILVNGGEVPGSLSHLIGEVEE